MKPFKRLTALFMKYPGMTAVFLVLCLLYVGLTEFAPIDPITLSKYHLDSMQVHLLLALIAVPYVAIWIVALVGYLRLRSYNDTIKGSSDGKVFKKINQGIAFLALWLPIAGLSDTLVSSLHVNHPGSSAALTIIDNYLNIILLFVAYSLINEGTGRFRGLARGQKIRSNQWWIIGYIAFASLYTWLALSDPVRHVASDATLRATYYQPDWLIVTTVLIPRLIMWYLGMQAVRNIYHFSKNVKGNIYRLALHRLALGIGWVIVTTIVLRAMQSLSSQLNHLNLAALLLYVLILLLLIAAGFVMIAQGAQKLQKLEEV